MNRFFDPDLFARTYRDPMAWLTLMVDLLPVIAVLFFGWQAVPLVALYWLENLVIGAFTILRMLGTVANNAVNLAGAAFMVPFFTVHYGMFCFGHGIFLRTLQAAEKGAGHSVAGLCHWSSGRSLPGYMVWFVAAIIGVTRSSMSAISFCAAGIAKQISGRRCSPLWPHCNPACRDHSWASG